MLNKIKNSLRAKFFFLLFGLNLAVIIVVGGISYNSTRHALMDQLEGNLSVIVSQLSRNVDGYIAARMDDTEAIALHYSLFDLKTTTSNQNVVLARYLRIYPYYQQISIINIEDMQLPGKEGKTHAQAPWYLPAMHGRSVTSDMMLSRITDKPELSFASPVKDGTGKVVSILTTNLKLEYLWNIIDHVREENANLGTTGYAFMVNRNGVLLAHPDPAKILTENLYDTGNRDLTELVKNMTLARVGTSTFTYKGTKMFVAYSPCKGYGDYTGHGWSIAVAYPYSEIFSPLGNLLSKYILIFLLTSLAALFVSTQLANYLVRPILSLKDGAARIGAGEFGLRIEADRSDELGSLADSFNDMAATLQARDEQLVEYTNTLTDINTELGRKQEELSRANSELTAANEELKALEEQKAEFTEMLTHDIKSPLSTIITYTDMILNDTIPGAGDQLKKATSSINASAYKILSLVDNFLASSAIEAGRLQFYLKDLDINEFVDDSLQFYLPRIEKKNIRFVVSRGHGLPHVKADKVQIDRALSNLMSNAIKFTPAGGEISLTTGQDGQYVFISVSDSGKGIPADEVDELFKKFKRSKSAGKVEGMGLGLFITKAIVEGHSGHMAVQTAPGEGATFTIFLPASRVERA